MSYYKSESRDNGNNVVATFYFRESKYFQVRVADMGDMLKIEQMLDHCYNLGVAHEKALQRACVAEWENKYVATVG